MIGEAHCEQYLISSSTLLKAEHLSRLGQFDYISGHFKLDVFLLNKFERGEYFLFTFLREPIAQLISHINWVIHTWEVNPSALDENAEIKEIAQQLLISDLYNPDIFISCLQASQGLFRNNQSKYFSTQPEREGSASIIRKLLQLDLVGITEYYSESLRLFMCLTGLKKYETVIDQDNQNLRYRIGKDILKNRLIHEFLLDYASVDLEVYDYFLNRFRETLRQEKNADCSSNLVDIFSGNIKGDYPLIPLSRTDRILFDIDLSNTQGVEIGPLRSPIVHKNKNKNNIFYLDYLSTTELKQRYSNHSFSPEEIVEVDYVLKPGLTLKDLFREGQSFDYMIASHVIEHLPNPIRWMEEIWEILKVSGRLSLVIPDKRFCFDYLRHPTTSGDWIAAYLNQATRPSEKAVFDAISNAVTYNGSITWNQAYVDYTQLRKINTLEQAFKLTKQVVDSGIYHEVHSWCFTPDSFLKILHDLIALGLLNFSVAYFHDTVGCEFYIILKKELKDSDVGGLLLTMPHQLRYKEVAIPRDFNTQRYLNLNIDVAEAGVDPIQHFIQFGRTERRKYS